MTDMSMKNMDAEQIKAYIYIFNIFFVCVVEMQNFRVNSKFPFPQKFSCSGCSGFKKEQRI